MSYGFCGAGCGDYCVLCPITTKKLKTQHPIISETLMTKQYPSRSQITQNLHKLLSKLLCKIKCRVSLQVTKFTFTAINITHVNPWCSIFKTSVILTQYPQDKTVFLSQGLPYIFSLQHKFMCIQQQHESNST